jgi:SNF2 family DNA or RNA helicase
VDKLRLHGKDRMLLMSQDLPPDEWQGRWQGAGWSFPIDEDLVTRLILRSREVRVDERLREVLSGRESINQTLQAIADLEDCDGRADLYDWQRVGVRWLAVAGRAILADDRGIGKTVQAIVAAEELGAKKVLVICSKGMAETWEDHIRRWMKTPPPTAAPTGMTLAKDLWTTGWVIINPTQLAGMVDDLRGQIDLIIVDEAHLLRNRKTKAFQALKTLRSDYLFLLTGTMKVNKIGDVWPLLHVLHPKRFTSYWSFVYRFCEVTDNGYGLKVGDIRREEIGNMAKLLSSYVLRRERANVLDLPEPKPERTIWCEMTKAQANLYEQMEREAVAMCDDQTVAADVKIAQITRLRQLLVDPGAIWPGYHGGSGKYAALLREVRASEGKLLVFSQFAEVIDRCSCFLESWEVKTVIMTGKTSKKQRDEVVKKFQEGDAKVFLATLKTGGEGLTLTAADKVVLLDPAWHPAGNQQAQDRVNRIGQTKSTETIILRIKDTIDDFMWAIVEGKGQVTIVDLVDYLRMKGAASG